MEGRQSHHVNSGDNSDTIDAPSIDSTTTTNNTATIDPTNTAAPASAEPESEASTTPSDIRLQRITDYLEEALAKASPLEANLGATNADLQLIAYRMKQALEEALQQGPATIADLEELERTLEQYIKITKQIDRFTQAAMKLAASPSAQGSKLPEVLPKS